MAGRADQPPWCFAGVGPFRQFHTEEVLLCDCLAEHYDLDCDMMPALRRSRYQNRPGEMSDPRSDVWLPLDRQLVRTRLARHRRSLADRISLLLESTNGVRNEVRKH